jgi:ribonuclease J
MEGTHIGHPNHQGPTEHELEDQIANHIQSAPGIVLATFSPQHVDRLTGLLAATRKAGRTFVADAYAAFVMHLVASQTSLPRPESQGWGRIFLPTFFVESSKRKRLEKVFSKIEPVRILMHEIQANPAQYVMIFRPSMLESDFGGVLPGNARCLHSRWSGYRDKPDWQSVETALNAAGGDTIQAHTSGHIYADDIASLVRQINPRALVPIHTFEPEGFRGIVPNVCLLNDGDSLDVAAVGRGV